jgi:hypothetical protein
MHWQACHWFSLHGQVPQLEAHKVPAEHVAPAAAEAQAAGGRDDFREEGSPSLQEVHKKVES